jgi:DNA-directed RNA polymerase subunit L
VCVTLSTARLQHPVFSAILSVMSSVHEIEMAIQKLTIQEKEAIRNWLDEVIEDQMEVSDQFKEKIERAKAEIDSGIYARTRRPDSGQ